MTYRSAFNCITRQGLDQGSTALRSSGLSVEPGWGDQQNRLVDHSLFRYSALTFNGHRIHYDADYCRSVEGYSSQVIHGPLNATVLAGFAERIAKKRLRQFDYRGLRPALLGSSLTLNAVRDGKDFILWVSLPDGTASMQAVARF